MKQFLKNIMAAVPKLPAPDLKALDSELSKLRLPEQKEAERLARIAQIEADKARLFADQAEAQRLSDIEALMPAYEEACENWAGCLESLQFELRGLIEQYQRAVPANKLARSLANQLKNLGVRDLPVPSITKDRADHWLRYLADNLTLAQIFHDVERQLAAEEVGIDD